MPTSGLKAVMSKCNNCYVSSTEKPLHKCAGCKAAKYCSKECQRADWKAHKPGCLNNAALASALKAHEQTPMGLLDRLLLPDGISMYELDQRLEKWVRFHKPTLMDACIHACEFSQDLGRTRTHVIYVKLRARPQSEHGGLPGKYFGVVDAYPVLVAEAEGWDAPWPQSLKQLRDMQDDSERMKRGRMAACMVECRPLAVQTVPFGSIKCLKGTPAMPHWKEVLVRDVEAGKKFGDSIRGTPPILPHVCAT